MARQPDRPRPSNLGPARTISPSVAASQYQQRIGLANTVFKIGQEVANNYTEDQVNIANAEHRQTALDTMAFSEENQTLTPQELKELGILDKVDTTDAAGNEMQAIPRHRWRAILLEHNVEQSRAEHGASISQPKARDAWSTSMQKTDAELIGRVTMQTARDAWEHQLGQMDARFKLAVEQGDWAVAQEIMDSQIYGEVFAANPELKKAMQYEVDKGEELSTFDDLMIQGRYDEVMDMVTDVDRATDLSSDELRKVYFAAATQQDKIEADREKQLGKYQESTYTETVRQLVRGNIGVNDVVDLPNGALSISQLNSAVSLARSLADEKAKPNSLQAQADMNGYLLNIKMARFGLFDDSYEDLDAFIADMRFQIAGDITRQNPDGTYEPGLNSTQLNQLYTELENLDEVAYDTQEYKNVVQQLRLRILRSPDDQWSPFATDESSANMANALDDLARYIDREGPAADLGAWQETRMPRYLKIAEQLALEGFDPGMGNYIKKTGAGDIDYEKSAAELQEKRNKLVSRGQDTSTIDTYIRQFNQFRDKFEAK